MSTKSLLYYSMQITSPPCCYPCHCHLQFTSCRQTITALFNIYHSVIFSVHVSNSGFIVVKYLCSLSTYVVLTLSISIHAMGSWQGNPFHATGLLWRETTGHYGFPSQWASNAGIGFLCWQSEQADEHTVELLVIWDAMSLMWHCSAFTLLCVSQTKRCARDLAMYDIRPKWILKLTFHVVSFAL